MIVQTGLIVGISLIFCAVYAFIRLHQRKDYDTEDSDGYLEIMMKEEVKQVKNNKMLKKLFALVAVVCVVFAMAVPAFAVDGADYAQEAVSAMTSGLAEVTGTLTIGNILTVILSVLGIAVGFMFFWWGLRKILAIVKRAFTKGKVSV